MHAFEIADLIAQHQSRGELWTEFLRLPSLSMGLYALPAGGVDTQLPHGEDEVYYVIHGRATIQVGNEDRPVRAGSIVCVAAMVDHRFHSITEDLTVLVFFAPAEGTTSG